MTTTRSESLPDRIRIAANDLTNLCKILTASGPNEDVDERRAVTAVYSQHAADIEDNLVAVAQEILDVLHLAGHDVTGAIDCLADVVDAIDAEVSRPDGMEHGRADPTLLINVLARDVIRHRLATDGGRQAFVEKLRTVRDSYDGVSATHWQIWDDMLRGVEDGTPGADRDHARRHLHATERDCLASICADAGPGEVLRLVAGLVANSVDDVGEASDLRIAINKLALRVEKARDR